MKKGLIVLAIAAIVALPFLLRPQRAPLAPADDVVIIVTPNNEAIRHEFELGFRQWYRARTGRSVAVDWRVLGGTSEIARFIQGQYVAGFQNLWSGRLGRPWSAEVQAGFQNDRLPADAPAIAREARARFLGSDVTCGIDLFYGGGSFDFDRQAAAGSLVASDIRRTHPDWFGPMIMPERLAGQPFRDPGGLWFGSVLSFYGIIYNRDSLRRIGFDREPGRWADLADPRFYGQVALCDPTKSGSIAMAFENVVQQQMHLRLDALTAEATEAADAPARERRAVREGWLEGLRLIQQIGANARYFTDTSQKIPIDVASGDCAAGMCIDFYGREQAEAVLRRAGSDRLGFASPPGGTGYSVDPIALLRGAPHRAAAEAFIEYVLSLDGQKLWDFIPGTPGGPREFALRRLPVRRDFYDHAEWKPLRSDPADNPYTAERLDYRPEWTGPLFRELAWIIRVMCQDTHEDLARAWGAIVAAPEPARSRALAVLQDLSAVDYGRAGGAIRQALESRNQVDEVLFARDLAESFRRQYRRAEAVAKGGP